MCLHSSWSKTPTSLNTYLASLFRFHTHSRLSLVGFVELLLWCAAKFLAKDSWLAHSQIPGPPSSALHPLLRYVNVQMLTTFFGLEIPCVPPQLNKTMVLCLDTISPCQGRKCSPRQKEEGSAGLAFFFPFWNPSYIVCYPTSKNSCMIIL